MTTESMVTIVTPRIASCGSSGASFEMNWGSTATMKMMPFGLVALVRKPVSTRRPNGGCASRPTVDAVGPGAGAARHWLTPR